MPASISRLGAVLLVAGMHGVAHAAAPLIDAVDSSDAAPHVNVFVQLSCSARYLGQSPRDSGKAVTIRLRLGADCGPPNETRMSERAAAAGASAVVRGVHVDYDIPGEAALSIEWSGEHRFLVLPTSNSRGVRLRILDVFPPPRSAVVISPIDEVTSGYAVNLESATTPFDAAALNEASRILKTPVHVSTVELAGETWYRLRAGPIGARVDAQRLLAVGRSRYPRAWLGVADEPAAAEIVTPPERELARPQITDAALPAAELAPLMTAARRAVAARDYPRAIELLTKLTRQPEFEGRARAQEMLGLTRERSGQLAHAKAEYEEYLRRYPLGDAAGRIRARLRALSSAQRVGRNGSAFGGSQVESNWRIDGGASQLYRWERSELTTTQASATRQDQNALYTDGDFIARRRGERFDFVSRLNAGYAYDMLSDGPGDQVRVSAAFVELNDRELGVATRFGRQSRNSGGLLGTFDGLFASYQLETAIALNFAAGFPVESTRAGPETDRRFLGLSADFGPFHDELDFGVFAVLQQIASVTDRQGVGVEARYFVPGRTLLAMVDYDLHYQELNSAVLTGSLQLPARWSVSFSADHRQAPVLTTRNALIGQPVETMGELLGLFAIDEVEQLARDRTAISDLFSISFSRPLGERFQFDLEAYGTQLDATPASGGVPPAPATGLEQTFQMQLSATNFAHANDLWVLSLRHQNGSLVTTESVSLATRLPVGGAWRLGPRLRVDRRESTVDGAREILYVPTLRLDYRRGRAWFECEAAAEFGNRQLLVEEESSSRYYFGLGYRLSF
jgi:hypothetical protein